MAYREDRERRRRNQGDEGYGYYGRRGYGSGDDYQREGRFGRGDMDRGYYGGEGTGRAWSGADYGYGGGREYDYEDDAEYGGYSPGYYGSEQQGRGWGNRGWGGYPGSENRSGSYGRAGRDYDEGAYDRGYGGYGYGGYGRFGREQERYGYESGRGYGERGHEGSRGFRGGRRGDQGEQRFGGGYDREQDFGYSRGYRGPGQGYGRSAYGGEGYGQERGRGYDYGTDYDADFDEDMEGDTQYWTYSEVWYIPGPFSGMGPEGYQRSDDRIREDVCEMLTRHGQINAHGIQVEVNQGNVTLRGTVDDRQTKRRAEDVIEQVSGVQDVNNELRVQKSGRGEEQAGSGRTGADRSDSGGTMGNWATSRETGSATQGSTTEGTDQGS